MKFRVALLLFIFYLHGTLISAKGASLEEGLKIADDENEDDEAEDEDGEEGDSSAGNVVTQAEPAEEGASLSEVESLETEQPVVGHLSLLSDYHFRGVTQTEHQPALQGGLDAHFASGVRFGVWGSAARLPEDSTSAEIAVGAGYGIFLARDLKAEMGIAYYEYFEGGRGAWEFPIEINWKQFKLGLSYIPRWNAEAGHAWYASAGWSPQILWGLTLPLSVGSSFLSAKTGYSNYADFRFGFAREFLGLEWELDGVFVDHEQFNGGDKPWIILSLAKYF
jgi:uncharacterized protein (TIGR02001 family)